MHQVHCPPNDLGPGLTKRTTLQTLSQLQLQLQALLCQALALQVDLLTVLILTIPLSTKPQELSEIQGELTSLTTNKSTESDVWWFIWPYDMNEKPSKLPLPFPDSC